MDDLRFVDRSLLTNVSFSAFHNGGCILDRVYVYVRRKLGPTTAKQNTKFTIYFRVQALFRRKKFFAAAIFIFALVSSN